MPHFVALAASLYADKIVFYASYYTIGSSVYCPSIFVSVAIYHISILCCTVCQTTFTWLRWFGSSQVLDPPQAVASMRSLVKYSSHDAVPQCCHNHCGERAHTASRQMLHDPANLFRLLVKAVVFMNDFPFEFKVFIKILHHNLKSTLVRGRKHK